MRLILSLEIWEEEDNIAIDRDIPCLIYAYMPSTRFIKKDSNASDAEVASELASELSSGERGYLEVVESQVVDFINNYAND